MRVLLVEDSATVRAYIVGLLSGTDDIVLLPPVTDGNAAVEAAIRLRPDLILMDLILPGLDGLTAISQIMEQAPCPIVVLSARIQDGKRERAFDAFAVGAVDALAKPESLAPATVAAFRQRLLAMVRLMSQARVIRRLRKASSPNLPTLQARPEYGLLAIGGSTGAPQVLFELLQQLPPPFPLPMLIVQHTLLGFDKGLAEWLASTGHRVRVAQEGVPLRPGDVWIAPSDRHMLVHNQCLGLTASLSARYTPSVDALFFSVARTYGAKAVALLLSGMGNDGAAGLLELSRAGAITVTQRLETCKLASMPASARALGAAAMDLSPSEMVSYLRSMLGNFRP